MSAYDYSRAVATANRLLTRFGQLGAIRRTGAPTGPAYDPTPGAVVDHPARFAMLDYEGKVGMCADVAPEYSRADIVATVRNHLASDRPIVHVKLIEGNDMQDVTAEIVADALALEAAE